MYLASHAEGAYDVLGRMRLIFKHVPISLMFSSEEGRILCSVLTKARH